MILEVDDLIILLLGAPSRKPAIQDRIEGITRLEKLIFLLHVESGIGKVVAEDPEFEAYNFGPFSKKVYQAVETLSAAGLLEDSSSTSTSTEDVWETEEVIGAEVPDPYATRNFKLTEMGKRYYEALLKEVSADMQQELENFKTTFGSIPLRQLVRYVYERHPDFTHKSIIKDEILGS